MADGIDLERIESWIGDMLSQLEPGPRRRVAMRIAQSLRRANSDRIGAQVQPDGTRFVPRKPAAGRRGRVGKIKERRASRKMFAKLRQTSFLRAEATPDEAAIGFEKPTVSRVARVHQLGLRDRVSRRGESPQVDYAERVLLGFAPSDQSRILDLLLHHLEN